MPEWLTGPEAVALLRAWCVANGTTVSRLVGQCTPPVHRSTIGQWAKGAAPQRFVWERLVEAMDDFDRKMMDYLLGGTAP